MPKLSYVLYKYVLRSRVFDKLLTYQSANPDDVPLKPNHFLQGQIGGKFAPEVDKEISGNLI